MAVVYATPVEVTGLSDAGSATGGGSWNTGIDVTASPYNVPSDAEAVIVEIYATGSNSRHIGLRPSSTPTNSDLEWIGDQNDDNVTRFLTPIASGGTIDIYLENSNIFYILGYMESGSMEWLDTTITRTTTTAGATSWDFSGDNASATGIIILNDDGSTADFSYATAASPTAYSIPISHLGGATGSDYVWQTILPLNGSNVVHLSATSAGTETYNIVGFITQDISILYNDDDTPSETMASNSAYGLATYDYGTTDYGLGMFIADNSSAAETDGFYADYRTTEALSGVSNFPENSAVIHPVRDDGTFYYDTELQTAFDVNYIWWMGPASTADTTAPVLTSPTAGSLTTDGVTPSVTTDEGNGTLYWGIYADAASPTAAQVVAGTSAILSGSQAVSGTGSQAVSAQTGLDDATSYELFFVHDDAAANRSNLSTVGFTTSTDSTAPSLTSPTAGSVSSTSVAPTVTTDTAEGTAYARVYANGATPTNSQVQSGTGVTPVGSSTNITVGASGVLNFAAITGLTEGTDYELYFVHEDDATTPNLSAVSTVGFTTTAAARSVELTAANGYELRDETGSVVASLNGIVWEWYDDPDSTAGSPTDSGTFNTSAGGEATITITGSSLADGAFGTLWVRHPTDDEIRGNYYLPITVS